MPNPKRGKRWKIWRGQKGACYYCGKRTHLPQKGNPRQCHNTATLDHIIPLSKGGAYAPSLNCVVACAQCNVERGNTDARLFWLHKQGML